MKQNSSLKVFLCDLTHNTIILVSDTIPINIGFIGSYMKKIFGNQIEIILFKYLYFKLFKIQFLITLFFSIFILILTYFDMKHNVH